MKPLSFFTNKILLGDHLKILGLMEDNVIDLTVTSPPYDELRDYDGYSFNFKELAKELYRVTKSNGVIIWIVGDQTKDGSESGSSFKQALYFKEIGFKLHDTMIYHKSSFSAPSSNRYYQIFEFMFVFVKGKLKKFNPLLDHVNTHPFQSRDSNTKRMKDGTFKKMKGWTRGSKSMRRNIWYYSTGLHKSSKDTIAFEHPAIFPEKLAEDHILSWSNEGDIVLDPMVGSGTTCKMARKNRRKFIGIDISKEYCKLALKRVNSVKLSHRLGSLIKK